MTTFTIELNTKLFGDGRVAYRILDAQGETAFEVRKTSFFGGWAITEPQSDTVHWRLKWVFGLKARYRLTRDGVAAGEIRGGFAFAGQRYTVAWPGGECWEIAAPALAKDFSVTCQGEPVAGIYGHTGLIAASCETHCGDSANVDRMLPVAFVVLLTGLPDGTKH